jgi:hypothetical protein
MIRLGRDDAGSTAVLALIEKLEGAKLAGEAASVRLGAAEALSGRSRFLALTLVEEALRFFEPRQIWESVLRGHLIAAAVVRDTGDIKAHRTAAHHALSQLRIGWTPPTVDRYLHRPDLTGLSRGLSVFSQ